MLRLSPGAGAGLSPGSARRRSGVAGLMVGSPNSGGRGGGKGTVSSIWATSRVGGSGTLSGGMIGEGGADGADSRPGRGTFSSCEIDAAATGGELDAEAVGGMASSAGTGNRSRLGGAVLGRPLRLDDHLAKGVRGDQGCRFAHAYVGRGGRPIVHEVCRQASNPSERQGGAKADLRKSVKSVALAIERNLVKRCVYPLHPSPALKPRYLSKRELEAMCLGPINAIRRRRPAGAEFDPFAARAAARRPLRKFVVFCTFNFAKRLQLRQTHHFAARWARGGHGRRNCASMRRTIEPPPKDAIDRDVASTGNYGSGAFDARTECLLGIVSRKFPSVARRRLGRACVNKGYCEILCSCSRH